LNTFDKITSLLKKNPIKKDDFIDILLVIDTFISFQRDELIPFVQSLGYPIEIDNDEVLLKSAKNSFRDEVFCIVDIETNGNSAKNSQIIEIGAIKLQNFRIIDRFESFVYANTIPQTISEITSIVLDDLKDAPSLESVMREFKSFLKDAIFVAHNVSFDYKFISETLEKLDLGVLLNRKLCSIDLARRTIESSRYGLKHLMELMQIDGSNHHRAYADALATTEIFQTSLKKVPQSIVTTEDLIEFSKSRIDESIKSSPVNP